MRRDSLGLFGVLVLGALFAAAFAGDAAAAPTARFTATPVQGATCVAPCVVHLDATATTDPNTTRPFHELDYDWECGEPGAGTWPTKLGGDKNRPRGPVTGCVYETPGAKTARLTVRAGDGTSHVATQSISVTAPRDHFGSSGTYCFRSSATGDFLGCPLDADANGSCELDPGGHCATQASFVSAISACGANTAKRACYFRRGDTFSGGAGVGLSGTGTTPGMVGAFGPATRPRPILSGSQGLGSLRSYWTIHDLTVQATGGELFNQIGVTDHNLTVYKVAASGPLASCISSATGGGTVFTDLLALVELDCNSTSVDATAIFLRAERALVLGTRQDSNGTGEFNLRTVHWWKSAIQHSDLISPGNPANGGRGDRNPLQLRSWAQSTNDENPSGVGPPPKESRWNTVSDNYFEWHGGNTSGCAIRTCQNNDCTTMPGGTGAGDPQDMVDLLVERNFAAFDGSAATANLSSGLVWAQGGRMTIRNNVIDLQGMTNQGARSRILRHSPRYTDCDGCTSDEIVVQNNTVYYDETTGNEFDMCEYVQGTGHVCQLNLVWRPNDSAAGGLEVSDLPATTGGNLYATASPFASTPPNRGLTLPSHFQLASNSAARNRLASAARDVVIDHGGRCRAGVPTLDAGAWEQGASACAGGTAPVCGNGQTESPETCDDGNTVAGDGCSAICTIEAPVCGNGVREGSEACDDGNASGGDGCRANCTIERCGDAVRDPQEGCDDGNTSGGDGCSAVCTIESTPVCGNGLREGSEACDDGNASSGDGCRVNCTIERCGDAIRDPQEGCDDGNTSGGDGCSASCAVEPSVCGNGVRDAGEACDDGNTAGGDGCRANCTTEVCGDQIVDPPGETCDDGNSLGGDGCRAECRLEICGDGTLDANEECDDGDTQSGDGCTSGCANELGANAGRYRVNLGATTSYTDPSNNVWSPDGAYASGGRIATHAVAVPGTTLDTVLQSRRYGAPGGTAVTIELPVPATGPYQVRLYFAELDPAVTQIGQRVFDVVLEGVFRIEDIDVVRAVGAGNGHAVDFFLNVDDGSLSVRLEPQVGEAMLSGIQTQLRDSPTESPSFFDPCEVDPQSCE